MRVEQMEEEDTRTGLDEAVTIQTGNRQCWGKSTLGPPSSTASFDNTRDIVVQTGFCTFRCNSALTRALPSTAESPCTTFIFFRNQYSRLLYDTTCGSRLVRNRGKRIVRSAQVDRHRQETEIGHSYRAELDAEG